MNVEAILKAKGHRVLTVRPDASAPVVARMLLLEQVGAVVVSEDGVRLAGIVAERDLVHGFAEHGELLSEKRAADLMRREVPTCSPRDSLKHVMRQMTRQRARHLPVLDGGRLCGVVSIGDVVKNLLEELELETDVLRDAYRVLAH